MKSERSGGDGARRKSGGFFDDLDPLRVLVALLLFLTISRVHQHFGFIGALQPAMLLFVAAAGYAVLNSRSVVLGNLTATWPPKVVMGIGVMAIVSVPFALSIGNAGSFFVNAFSKVLLTFFLMLAAVRRTEDLKLFVWSYVLACGFLVYISVFSFGLQTTGGMMRLSGVHTFDANDLGLVLATGMPLCLVLYENSGLKGRVLSAGILFGIGVSLARSGSRGGFLGLVAVGLMLLFLTGRVSLVKRLVMLGAVVAGLALFAPQGYWEQMETLTQPTEDYNWTAEYGRKAVAERGIGYMLDNPLAGIGVGNFPRAEGVVADVAQRRQEMGAGYRWSAAHNSFVQIGAELGIPGLFLFCALVFGGALGMYRLRRRLPRGWKTAGGNPRFLYDMALYLPVSLVGFAVTGFFLSFAYMDIVYVLTVFVAGTYLCVRQVLLERGSSTASGTPTVAARVRVQ